MQVDSAVSSGLAAVEWLIGQAEFNVQLVTLQLDFAGRSLFQQAVIRKMAGFPLFDVTAIEQDDGVWWWSLPERGAFPLDALRCADRSAESLPSSLRCFLIAARMPLNCP